MSLRRSIYKSPAQLRLMIAPGLATAASLDAARALMRAGVTTLELDAAAEAAIVARGGLPNFKLEQGYFHTVCASVNEDVVHGIPGARVLAPGDIVSIDSGAILDGWNGDAAFSFVIPDPSRPEVVAERQKLSDVTEQSLWHGIARLAEARYLNEVGDAIEDYIESQGSYGILTDYVGHGIGRSMHEAPPVFNYRVRQKGPEVKPGLVVAIEPMVVLGSIDTFVRDDDWTVATSDGLAAAHWEHSVAVHKDGIWVLTAEDGGAAQLAPLGVIPVPIP
ncbi:MULTISPECIES: type I methionyl aminopeptidase [Cryobacterium]|uniref:Methionine aminopeptidase n=2 Tax=Cryobacterium TaxID=69578 RepID=A0ABY2IM91_9MICO|nr:MULTISPECIES: type I methionyl aminopeptidase [Cryobacterium]MEB0287272.1 type I methionyl aminopeptidase [Cryobacterium sp. 10S3]TFB98418.1 type I methionyl aminopeptidase [Cryobacterium sp. MDB2-A-1]TFC08300.1 type I methionyl aminopeptidase [Cryobacterium sp. MDB2-33-2]TFC08567.1 type I methionyl aminopeptidase [Cryobacterium sp. MDB2-A-2]TFC20541.1 type I methionyl aminopeptidase [Cryobacterium glucosi]